MRKVILLLLSSLVVLGVLSVGLIVWGQRLNPGPIKALSLLPTNVDMRLSGVNYTEVNGGQKEWDLKADSLRYSRAQKILHFDQVKITLYLEHEGKIDLSGNEGFYDRTAKLVSLSGRVVIQNDEGYRVMTQELTYHIDTKRIVIPGLFKIIGPKFSLDGRHLSWDIDTRLLKVHHQAKMLFKST
ncbi:MAG: LPS export ABC transporter periplasmic protein LptC [Deltaproteobacteria bacterium]|nr:LPS export ABC transporter periplasmic protein LptC [Deltaproteobacteria bacterium]